MHAQTAGRRGAFGAYLCTQASWFFAFGLQTALFPFVARVVLQADEAGVGLAQTSLTAPSIVLVLLAGVVAERFDKRALLIALHLTAILPPLTLGLSVGRGALAFSNLILYGLSMGAIAALMLPTRDSALNAVARLSPGLTIQRAVVLASLVQFVGQIAGMVVASLAAFSGPAPLMAVQAVVLGTGAIAAALMPALTPHAARDKNATVAFELLEGLRIVWANPVIRAMVLLMGSVGVFVIGGSFLVLLPLLVLDEYGGIGELGVVLMTFWTGAAGATVLLARLGHVHHPGRPLALALAVGAASLLVMMIDPVFPVLLLMVAIWGASGGLGIALSRAIVQEAAPPQALSRVLSAYQLGFLGGAPIGALAIGLAAQAWGLKFAALIPMIGVLATAAWLRYATPVGRLRVAASALPGGEIGE
ncbi:MAG: MFS transporter [Maricaulaceae bacterium]|jgi:MFS family permease